MFFSFARVPLVKILLRTACAGSFCSSSLALAFQIPNQLFIDDDFLYWQSDAPSINVYQDGSYLLTLHGEDSFGPVREGSLYQLVGHDFGTGFTPLSTGIIAENDDGGDSEESEFDEARLYFELNDTDGDIGLHSLVDVDAWRTLSIEDRQGSEIFSVEVEGALAAQGMTEIFFESAEPNFDDLNPADFFARFPEGEYEISADGFDGNEFESIVTLSHIIPAAPSNMIINGELLDIAGGCEDNAGPVVAAPYVVSWDPVTHSHAFLGTPGEVEVDIYQVVIEREEPTELHISIDVGASITQMTLPQELFGAGEEIKMEVLTIANSFNQSASETCFVTAD